MAGEVRVVPRPGEFLPDIGTPDALATSWRTVLAAVEGLVDAVSVHRPRYDGCCTWCASDLPCRAHDAAVGALLVALDDLAPKFVRLDADAATDVVPGSPFVRLTDRVSVDPAEVAAVTQHPQFPDETHVWIRADRVAAIRVSLPMPDVVGLLDRARSAGT